METEIGSFSYILSNLFSLLGSDVFFYTVSGGVLVVLLLLSATISGSEVAFFSLPKDQLSEFRESSVRKSEKIYYLLEDPKKLLATIVIFNNLVNVAFITYSTYFTWQLLGTKDTDGIEVIVLTIITTFSIVFFGEVIPKVYANQRNVHFANITVDFVALLVKFFTPVSAMLMGMTNIIEKRIHRKGYRLSIDEMNQALEITTGEDSTGNKEILKGIVNFGTIPVKQIMTSRLEITAVDIEMDFHELMDKINKCAFSRIPVFRETIDRIEGILYVKDLLPYIDEEETFNWQRLLRKNYFVPENKKIDVLLKDFQRLRIHMAIVVDEYGGTSGLVTLEDILEEIVGDIHDEYDYPGENQEIVKINEKTYIVEGKVSIAEFCKAIDENIEIFDKYRGESESIGGMLLEINSKMPKIGDLFEIDCYEFEVASVSKKKIKKIKVKINPEKIEQEEV